MAIEIVDLPINNGDFSIATLVYQRVKFNPQNPRKSLTRGIFRSPVSSHEGYPSVIKHRWEILVDFPAIFSFQR